MLLGSSESRLKLSGSLTTHWADSLPLGVKCGKRYSPHGKPIRFGYKCWVAATKLGYCLQFELYQWKEVAGNRGDLLVGEGIVLRLMTLIKEKYSEALFSVYLNNFFASPRILIFLMQRLNVTATGTVRVDRTGFCPLKSIAKMKQNPRGTFDTRFSPKHAINAVRWADNAVVTVLSNEFSRKFPSKS